MLKMKKLFSMLLVALFVFSLTVAYGEETKTKYPNEVMAEVGPDSPAYGPNTKEGEFIDETKTENESISKSPNEITVFIDGRQVNFPDTKPYIKNGRTLVPIRFVSQEMGAKVNWNNTKREVLIEKGGKKISLKIWSKEVYVNGTKKVIDVPAELKNGRTMVPLRFISEAFGANVRWIDAERKVVINTK
ncbi:hypothetical protein AN618_18560 [Fervidicola ferrireducens]|uniref:Copper amine oxidase-like N-terminal domain-containing protein n=1 Tax=Fervidicola ferrireducens TaxID=520764 RepID=A0A140L4L3_9FIRM|nr:copper amine oxidase N-terminal domain-containing protein [Fervidicola ferrireducens]KXG75488.1 hypothetical protein AN618_18560 [Fervidicola ferrireducens]